jgi:tetratricopeptide (TPR) repeat protein
MWPVAALAFLLFQAADFNAEGMKALEDRKYDAAVQAFTKAIEADPKDYTAHFNLALAYGFLHHDAEGIAEYRKTLEIKPNLYEAELNGAILLLRQKQPAEALPLLENAAGQKPQEFRPRYYLAESQLQTGDVAKAEGTYRAALEIDAKSPGAQLGLAHALARQGKLADAAPYFREAAKLDAGYRDALLELADLYERNHQNAEALAIYREFPDNPAVQEHVGQLMLDTKQYAEAIPRLLEAFQKSPTQANRVGLAAAYLFDNQIDKALPLLDQAVGAEPGNFEIRMMYGRALRDRKQYSAAAQQFSEAVRINPKDVAAWNDLAGMLYLMDDYSRALSAFDRARELGQDTPGNWFFRAIILDKLKQYKPALEAYQRFLAMSQGKNPDQEFQARQRARIIQRDLDRR